MILPGARFRTVLHEGEKLREKYKPNPIEFSNGTYQTDDPEEQEIIEEHDEFAEDLNKGNIALAPSERELDEADAEASTPGLQERLDAADSVSERRQILQDAGYPDLADDLGKEGNGTHEADAEANGDAADELDVIDGVSNKGDALQALDSIEQANEDVHFGVSTADNVDDIAEAAREHGYTFDGWPK
jgi:hypothetical protein